MPSPATLPTRLLNRLLARTRLRQLQLLVRVAELGSIQRAADEIGLSQPAATKAVGELEKLVNVRLFERHARGARPTDACRDLLPLVRNVLRSLIDCAQSLAASSEGGEGLVRVGAITGGVTGLIAQALPSFVERHPHVHVEVTEEGRRAMEAGVAEGLFDFALVRRPDAPPVGHRFVPLLQDRAAVVSGPGHPLARRRRLEAEDLLKAHWVLPPLDTQMRHAFDRIFAACGQVPASALLTTRSLPLVLLFLGECRAVSLAPLSMVRPFIQAGLLQSLNLRIDTTLPPIGLLMPEEAPKRAAVLLAQHLETWTARQEPSQRTAASSRT